MLRNHVYKKVARESIHLAQFDVSIHCEAGKSSVTANKLRSLTLTVEIRNSARCLQIVHV